MSQAECIRDEMTNRWYSQATVRYTPRILVPEAYGDQWTYPPARCPVVRHPLVEARGRDVLRYIVTQAAYLFLYNVGLIETRFVIQSSLNILHGTVMGIDEDDKLQALTVVIDEGYHAHVALDYVLQMRRESGIEPLHIPKSNQKLDAIERAAASLPEELRPDFNLMAVTIAENVVTEEVANIGRDKDLAKPFSVLMKDHVRDEGRHSIYFCDLMKSRWQVLTESQKEQLGAILPKFIEDYLKVDATRAFEYQTLRACEFSAEDTTKILADTEDEFVEEQARTAAKTYARLLRLLGQIGVLDLDVNRQAFTRHCYSL